MNQSKNRVVRRLRGFFKATRFAWLFVVKIGLFGAIYWGIFYFQPDAFNFVQGYNNNPMTTFRQEFYRPGREERFILDDSQDLTGEFRDRAAIVDAARRAYLLAERVEEEKEASYQVAIDVFQGSLEARIDSYEAENIAPLKAREQAIEDEMETLPFGSQKAITLSDEKLKISREILRHLTFIIENRITFATDEDQAIFDEARQQRDLARDLTRNAGDEYRRMNSELLDHFVQTRNQMLYQIGIVDFLYFSACISTTTTFGDITANRPWVRALVVMQILAGIIILAGFLNSLTVGERRS